jgi:hypothetical protein
MNFIPVLLLAVSLASPIIQESQDIWGNQHQFDEAANKQLFVDFASGIPIPMPRLRAHCYDLGRDYVKKTEVAIHESLQAFYAVHKTDPYIYIITVKDKPWMQAIVMSPVRLYIFPNPKSTIIVEPIPQVPNRYPKRVTFGFKITISD